MNKLLYKELQRQTDKLQLILENRSNIDKDTYFLTLHTIKGLLFSSDFDDLADCFDQLESSFLKSKKVDILENQKALIDLQALDLKAQVDVNSITFLKRYSLNLAKKLGKKVSIKTNTFNDLKLNEKEDEHIKLMGIHLINNALTHGLEKPRERNLKNKPSFGQLDISFYKKDGYHFLEICDDGRGLNSKEIETNLVSGRKKGLEIVKKLSSDFHGRFILENQSSYEVKTKAICRMNFDINQRFKKAI